MTEYTDPETGIIYEEYSIRRDSHSPEPEVDDIFIQNNTTFILKACDCNSCEGQGWPMGRECGPHKWRLNATSSTEGIAWDARSSRWYFSGTLRRKKLQLESPIPSNMSRLQFRLFRILTKHS